MTDRLDRIELILEQNARDIADNASAIKVLTEHQAQYAEQLRAEVTSLTELIQVVTQQHGETIARIDIMQSEVRGLQVENRRIMERWDNGNQN
jgi:tRNA A37 methylthiotransferase MiaB